jgi:hypothetical protein
MTFNEIVIETSLVSIQTTYQSLKASLTKPFVDLNALRRLGDDRSSMVLMEVAGNSYLRFLFNGVVIVEVQLKWTLIRSNERRKRVPDAFLRAVISSDLNSLYKAIFRVFLNCSAKSRVLGT